MSKLKVSLLIILMTIAAAVEASQVKISGCVIDEKESPIEYATVVFLKGNKQMGGTTTNDGGCFSSMIEQGKYEVRISYVGLNNYIDTIDVVKNIDLGKIILGKNSVVMKEVTVTASTIRREADRFVMQVEDQPITIGKNAEEILKEAPGVWISDDKISINGNSGTKIYINDREQNMSVEQLLNYLRSMSAEDISKIEVLPRAGAEYSADNQGGIIKITLKKNRDNGLMGSAGVSAVGGKDRISYSPRANLNAKNGDLSINASGWVNSLPVSFDNITEHTIYNDINAVHDGSNRTKMNGSTYAGATLGAIYDLNKKNTIGAEVQYSLNHQPSRLKSQLSIISDDPTFNQSDYNTKNHGDNWNMKLNYIHKLDTVGSTLKFMANYTYDVQNSNSDNVASITKQSITVDSIFRADTRSRYNVFNLSGDFDKNLSKEWNIKAGLKYTLNDMFNYSYFDYNKNGAWVPSTPYNYDIKYTENIYAGYAIANYNRARWQAKAGLRAEYSATNSKEGFVNKKYFDLFPNVNINYLLTEKGDYSIGLGYNRNIERPSFWTLSPIRRQISDYSYQVGDPMLKPSYSNDIELNLSFAYKYSLSASYFITNDGINQTFKTDPNDPRYLILTNTNEAKVRGFYVSAYAPVQITKWLSATANVTYVMRGEKLSEDKQEYTNNHMLFANGSINVNLPHNFFFETNFYYQKHMRMNNIEIDSQVYWNASLKKTFSDNKWVASVGVNNILGTLLNARGITENFTRDMSIKSYSSARISVTYNFNSGKKFNARVVESNEDASRLKKKSE